MMMIMMMMMMVIIIIIIIIIIVNARTGARAHTLTHKPVCEHEDITVLWGQGKEYTQRGFMASRPES
jgi:heme/copper-type cytochrome/quinol oxidase subunit 2